ncbi:MAG TPA: hypothetical protein VGL15_09490 [Vicinamibacteria bacterium]
MRGRFAVALSFLAVTPSAQQPPRFGERVEVERVLIDARVVDDRGDAIRGLAAADFRLRVDGRPVPLESVQWVSGLARRPRPRSPGSRSRRRPAGWSSSSSRRTWNPRALRAS